MPLATLATLALLQALLVSFTGSGTSRALAVILALATCSAAVAAIVARFRLLIVGILAALIVANFWQHATQLAPPIPYRIPHVAILAAYAAVTLALLGARVAKTTFTRALVASGLMAAAFVAAEGLLERLRGPAAAGAVTWTGSTEPHPDLGYANPVNTVRRTLYLDNPRGYFATNGPSPWILELHHPGSVATLQTAPDRPTLLRVNIERAADLTVFNIQLNQPGLSVSTGDKYALTFDARADSDRTIAYAISMAHAPFDSLGYYRNAKVGPTWQTFSEEFALKTTDANARLHFDVGASPASVEIDHVSLRRLPSGDLVRPANTATEFSVSYRFNALGCRGPDFPIPRPTTRHRILILGDSYALGEGVHEGDTFAARLEASLNGETGSSTTAGYDVINCSTRGYTFKQQRQYYEIIGSRYEPEIVLVSATPHDDASWRQETAGGQAVARLGPFESLFASARLFRSGETDRGPSLASRDVNELVTLAEAARARGARLAVVSFPQRLSPGSSTSLPTAFSTAVERAKAPLLDVGPILLKSQKADSLKVHPADRHPTEIAHQLAAVEIEGFLRSTGLIGR